MSAVTIEQRVPAGSSAAGRAARGWLVGPWFDALLIANVAWPLVVLPHASIAGRAGVEFWQVYYITTPHRWITLLLVFLDRERFGQRRGVFVGLAACAAALCLGVRFSTGTLVCLMTIDYLWNAWHFASQHHGIYRIYTRRSESSPRTHETLEKWAMRGFLLYVIVRVAMATWTETSVPAWLPVCDWIVLIVPAWLLLREATQLRSGALPRALYLCSLTALYVGLLWAVHERRQGLVLALATASALFHAIEYLAIVSWSVQQRHQALGSRMGVMSYLVPRWGITLAVFVLVLGAGGWLMNQRLMEVWLTINVVVAFLHYAYDGLIWRRRATA